MLAPFAWQVRKFVSSPPWVLSRVRDAYIAAVATASCCVRSLPVAGVGVRSPTHRNSLKRFSEEGNNVINFEGKYNFVTIGNKNISNKGKPKQCKENIQKKQTQKGKLCDKRWRFAQTRKREPSGIKPQYRTPSGRRSGGSATVGSNHGRQVWNAISSLSVWQERHQLRRKWTAKVRPVSTGRGSSCGREGIFTMQG